MPFLDRRDAGRRLGRALGHLRADHPVVVGLPRGGIPVAAEVARELDAPLDVLVVRKLGCPWQPELAMGAVGEGGVRVLNEALVADLGVSEAQIEEIVNRERAEVERRLARYRGDRQAVPVEGRTVIVVDDGIATGSTARAAVEVLRHRGARRVVLAVPVAPSRGVESLTRAADEFVVLEAPTAFFAVGQFYTDFAQTSDEEVTALLAGSAAPAPVVGGATGTASVAIELPDATLDGDLSMPPDPIGIVVFAHGSGSSRLSPRNRAVAAALNEARIATLLLDLLTPEEEPDRANVFDVELLAGRLAVATRWLRARAGIASLPLGYFGASTGAAAALWAAAGLPDDVAAVVSRGGRPDLAGERLGEVRAPTLLIVGGDDDAVLAMNRRAQQALRCPSALEVVPRATHLFEEPGALDRVAALATGWFARLFKGAARRAG
ncbi:MAG TPA: phosphoribosyltransferase [Actinomycetota bacterium]